MGRGIERNKKKVRLETTSGSRKQVQHKNIHHMWWELVLEK
jgi:hypothetical protein